MGAAGDVRLAGRKLDLPCRPPALVGNRTRGRSRQDCGCGPRTTKRRCGRWFNADKNWIAGAHFWMSRLEKLEDSVKGGF